MIGCRLTQFVFASAWHMRFDGLLQVAVETFIEIQLRRVAGQVKDFDLLLVSNQPLLERAGSLELTCEYPQVVSRSANVAFLYPAADPTQLGDCGFTQSGGGLFQPSTCGSANRIPLALSDKPIQAII